MSFIQDIPRTLILNDEDFTVPDVTYLKSLFPDMDMAILPKKSIRQDLILQKAIRSGAVLCNLVQTANENAMLSLTQDGKLLIGKA